jgi:hypothetical protein
MIAQSLKTDIEAYADRVLESNRLLQLARDGKVSSDMVTGYLFNIRYLIGHTVPCLELARDEAEARGWESLAGYYGRKLAEEHGHESWAENDFAAVRTTYPGPAPDGPSRAIAELVAYLRQAISADPRRYLAYVLFAEYFTVLAGPVWLRALEEKCGVPATMMTSVGHHIELDKAHVAAGLSDINSLVSDPEDFPRLSETLRRAIDYFERFCNEIVGNQN